MNVSINVHKTFFLKDTQNKLQNIFLKQNKLQRSYIIDVANKQVTTNFYYTYGF